MQQFKRVWVPFAEAQPFAPCCAVGGLQDEKDIYPDFVMMAQSFGVPSRRVIKKSEVRAAIREMLDTPGPYLLEVSHTRQSIEGVTRAVLLATVQQ
jgi:thiamine pyrophosphate-dependent acetolactate synthase large subunit-like protein